VTELFYYIKPFPLNKAFILTGKRKGIISSDDGPLAGFIYMLL